MNVYTPRYSTPVHIAATERKSLCGDADGLVVLFKYAGSPKDWAAGYHECPKCFTHPALPLLLLNSTDL